VYLSSQYPFDVFNELVGHHHDEMANTKPHSELEQKKIRFMKERKRAFEQEKRMKSRF